MEEMTKSISFVQHTGRLEQQESAIENSRQKEGAGLQHACGKH